MTPDIEVILTISIYHLARSPRLIEGSSLCVGLTWHLFLHNKNQALYFSFNTKIMKFMIINWCLIFINITNHNSNIACLNLFYFTVYFKNQASIILWLSTKSSRNKRRVRCKGWCAPRFRIHTMNHLTLNLQRTAQKVIL